MTLERRIADGRGVLRRGPAMARQILRKLFPGVRPVALLPAEGGGVTFRATAACAGVLAGIAYVTTVVPPDGSADSDTASLDLVHVVGIARAA